VLVAVAVGVFVKVQVAPGYPQGVLVAVGGTGVPAGAVGLLLQEEVNKITESKQAENKLKEKILAER